MTEGKSRAATPDLPWTLSGKWLAIAFVLLAAGVGVLWYSANAAYKEAVLRERGRELQAIAELKIEFVRSWLEERRNDAMVQSRRLLLPGYLRTPASPPGPYGAGEMQAQFEIIRTAYDYEAVLLLDRTGKLRLHSGSQDDAAFDRLSDTASRAMREGATIVSRAYQTEAGGRKHTRLDIAAPVFESGQSGAPVAGALVLHFDPQAHLDPLLQRWPAPSESGETFLVERVGGVIAYLSSLRHADAAAVQKKANDPSLPAAHAARGMQGVTEGLDYRGVPVVAAVGQVPGMPWFVVAKLDRDEILAPVRREARWSGALSALLLLSLGLIMFLWRRRSLGELALAQQSAAKDALAASEARFRKLHEHGWDFNALFDRDMVIRYASPSIDRYLGHQAVGETINVGTARVHPDDISRVEAARQSALSQPGSPQCVEHRLARGDGGWLTLESCFTNHFDDPDIDALAYTARDISGRIQAERLMRESEERYRYLFELSPDAVFVHRDNAILFANDAAARLFGVGPGQTLIGRDWHELSAPQNWARIESRIALLVSGEAAFLPPTELEFLTLGGQTIQVEATGASIVIDGAPAIMSVIRNISERRQAEAQRLAEARRQRDTLVREVHHRIKNHLQGLAGLLNQHKRKHPALQDALDAVIAQVTAISLIHGLQSGEADSEVRLYGLLKEIVRFQGSLVPLEFANAGNAYCENCAWRIADEESVPLALVLNELLTNAIKHRDAPSAPVRIACACNNESIGVTLGNAGSLPPDFDFAAGTGLGTGLTLLRSLLPRSGAALSFHCAGGQVETRLALSAPVVSRQGADQVASRR